MQTPINGVQICMYLLLHYVEVQTNKEVWASKVMLVI